MRVILGVVVAALFMARILAQQAPAGRCSTVSFDKNGLRVEGVVFGVPGDRVRWDGSRGLINDALIAEICPAITLATTLGPRHRAREIVVPRDSYYVATTQRLTNPPNIVRELTLFELLEAARIQPPSNR